MSDRPLRICAECGKRPALFQAKGKKAIRHVHTDRKHNLCMQCWRDQKNSLARVLPSLNSLCALLVLCLFAGTANAQTTTTVIGAIRDLSSTIVPGGQVTFELRPGGDTTITGNGRFASSTVTCSINQSTSFGATGVVRAANVVTVTFSSPHSFILGDVVTVTSMTDTAFNGTFTIASVADTTHVTWAQTAGNASTGGGLISALRLSPGPGSCKVQQNTALQPAGTSYQVCLWPLGSRTSCFNWYAIGAGPVDLSTTVPTPGGMPAYAFVDTLNNQTINGSKTFGGTVTFQGQVIFPSTFALSGTFSSATANAATVGIFRAANNENALCMRRADNAANQCLILDGTNTLRFNGSALGTGGTVTSTSSGNFSPLFNVSVANPTTTPAFSYAAISQSADLFYASPCGGAGNPTFRALCATDFGGNPWVDTSSHVINSTWDGAFLRLTIDGSNFGAIQTSASGAGIASKSGTGGSYSGNVINLYYDGAHLHAYTENTDLGGICFIGALNGTC